MHLGLFIFFAQETNLCEIDNSSDNFEMMTLDVAGNTVGRGLGWRNWNYCDDRQSILT